MTVNSRQILITKVEQGSPADGKLEAGDVVLGVFGQPFSEDARKTFGRAIGEAETETRQGTLPLTIWRNENNRDIELKLQVMGTYSDTSPYACPKAKKILGQGLAAMLKNFGKGNGLHINELALMTSGKTEYIELVRKSAHDVAAGTPDVETLGSSRAMAGWPPGITVTTISS